ncbi:uncharacterized protein L203_105992 [Cryptococcus depauperatus CBS 7841]|uniref:Uncharacterized protein n=1 Tax=Cryptococcus depauperatus CBS 7841 TaxID=1295531 RepID=A0A1E3IV25_9TREE|nr:S-adenosylmethionine-dependent methyltransferase [Cryptococcus depauperatus CBS 7841]
MSYSRNLRAIASHFSQWRPYSTTSSTRNHLQTMLLNSELTPDEASNELRWIISEVRAESQKLLSKGKLPPIEDERVGDLVKRRSEGEPLQYILGSTDFGSLSIMCRKPVLIPRPETAYIFTLLSSTILSSISPLTSSSRPTSPLPILDLCTGTGCISLLLAHLNPLSTIVGVDNSPAAVGLGGANVKQLDLTERVKIRYGNIFGPVDNLLEGEKKVGLVVSNPPYIPLSQWEQLPKSVRDFESPLALLGDGRQEGDGLTFYERIADILTHLLMEESQLREKGWEGIPRVAVEVGLGQAKKVENIFQACEKVKRTEIWNDQFGVERMVVGWS